MKIVEEKKIEECDEIET